MGRGRKVIKGINDLLTTHPRLAEEWDYEQNSIQPTEAHAGMRKKIWWKCKEHGHSWQATIQSRTRQGSGCPICAIKRTKKKR